MTSAPGEYRIEPGQEYESHDPGHDAITTIRVMSRPYPDWRGGQVVNVVTVTPDGRKLRPRSVSVRNLHANPDRKSGYRLVQHADGTPAASR